MNFFAESMPKNELFNIKKYTHTDKNPKQSDLTEMLIQSSVKVLFVLGGTIEISINDYAEIAAAGEIALIFPFQPHKYKLMNNADILILNFDSSLARDFFNPNYDTVGKNSVFKASSTTSFILENNSLADLETSRFTIQSLIYSMIADFLNQNELVQRKNDDDILMSTIAYMRKHKEQPLKMSNVAKSLGYSQSYFSFALNKKTGLSFNTLLATVRVESAKELLSKTDKSIIEIMLECGFGSERSFYRQFNDIVGISPLKYRASTFNNSNKN